MRAHLRGCSDEHRVVVIHDVAHGVNVVDEELAGQTWCGAWLLRRWWYLGRDAGEHPWCQRCSDINRGYQ